MSRATYPDGTGTAYIATAGTYPDALAGGPAAAARSAPVLLVNAESVPEETQDELRRLGVDAIVLLGGTASISASVEGKLNDIAPAVRLAGQSRFGTAAAVSRHGFPQGAPKVYVASGAEFRDALAAAAAAGSQGVPLLLSASDRLPEVTREELQRLAPQQIVAVGDERALTTAVFEQLAAIAPTTRVNGTAPFGTAVAVANEAFVASDLTYIATAEDFPDALSGGAAAGTQDAPLLFVGPDSVPKTVADELRRLEPNLIVVLGGPAAVSDAVLMELDRYMSDG